MGRPTDYNEELGYKICEGVSRKTSLARLCDGNDDMPHLSTVYRWIDKHQSFREMYARAKAQQADYLAEEILDVADDASIEPADKRVRVDARKWLAAKLKPNKYSDKHQIDHTSSDSSMTPTRIERVIIDPTDTDA